MSEFEDTIIKESSLGSTPGNPRSNTNSNSSGGNKSDTNSKSNTKKKANISNNADDMNVRISLVIFPTKRLPMIRIYEIANARMNTVI